MYLILTDNNQQNNYNYQSDNHLHLLMVQHVKTRLSMPRMNKTTRDKLEMCLMSGCADSVKTDTHLHVSPPHPPVQLFGSATERRRIV